MAISDRVAKIKERDYILQWHHVPTDGNPVDVGSRGGLNIVNNDLWRNGPEWLSDSSKWPHRVILESSPESNAEAKVSRKVLATTTTRSHGAMDELE
jgi:hypothetical protein